MNYSLKRLIKTELIRAFRSRGMYLSFLIILVGAVITFSRNYSLRNLSSLVSIGTINTFIYSNIVGNNIVKLLAPVVAGICYSITAIEDIRTGYYRQIVLRIGIKKYIAAKKITAILIGALTFIFSYLFIFALCYIVDPSTSIRTEFNRLVVFGKIYDYSMLMYCIAFILFSAVFGAIYSLLSLGIAMHTNNKYLVVGIPFFLYYTLFYLGNILPIKVCEVVYYFLPSLTFDVLQNLSINHYIGQLGFVFVCGLVLINIGTNRLIYNNYFNLTIIKGEKKWKNTN